MDKRSELREIQKMCMQIKVAKYERAFRRLKYISRFGVSPSAAALSSISQEDYLMKQDVLLAEEVKTR